MRDVGGVQALCVGVPDRAGTAEVHVGGGVRAVPGVPMIVVVPADGGSSERSAPGIAGRCDEILNPVSANEFAWEQRVREWTPSRSVGQQHRDRRGGHQVPPSARGLVAVASGSATW